MKSTGKGACILPHGVLFRGNVEAEIRKNILKQGYIKGIIGLPANLFYGTGIPACVIVLDMENANNNHDHVTDNDHDHVETRHALSLQPQQQGIFMIDASKGFIKDGNKNRLREQDIHKIVDVFNKQIEIPKFSRFVSLIEISDPKNDYNLNIPRYIDSQEMEDIQDIEAHLLGNIPKVDVDALSDYWAVYPSLKNELFSDSKRPDYCSLKVEKDAIKQTIFAHPEFVNFSAEMDSIFDSWKIRNTLFLKALDVGIRPKQIIHTVSEDALAAYTGKALMDKYDVYQHVMNYWNDTFQDDCYLIAVDGWKAEPYRIIIQNKAGKDIDKGWECDLVPKYLVIDRYFMPEKTTIETLIAQRDLVITELTELEEEQSAEDGFFADFDKEKSTKINAQKLLKTIDSPMFKGTQTEEIKVLKTYLKLIDETAILNKKIKDAETVLDLKALKKYKDLSIDDIKQLVVDEKWMMSIEQSVKTEMERISQRLTQRIKELAERYETPLPLQLTELESLEEKVNAHLTKMGFVWK